MNSDVFRAILAMDSYNRGYGQGVKINASDSVTGQAEIGRQLGNATITAQDITQSAKDAGFYASAYSWNGETVISYRGTNPDSGTSKIGSFKLARNDGWQASGV